MPDQPVILPVQRGQQVVELFDSVTRRLIKELSGDGELKGSTVTNALDLIRFAGLPVSQFVNFELTRRGVVVPAIGASLAEIAEATEAARSSRPLPKLQPVDPTDAQLQQRGAPSAINKPFSS